MLDGNAPDETDRPDGPPVSLGRRLFRGAAEIVGLLLLAAVLMLVVGRLRAPDLPEVAPDFALQTLDGETVRLSDLRGQTVVVNFWATWCAPCRVEIPSFSAYARNHPEVAVLGVATDGTPSELRGASRKLGIDYPVLVGDSATQRAYGVEILPTTVVVDAEGRVSSVHSGIMLQPQLALAVWLAR